MKYIGLLVSSVSVTLVILVNFYYNSITLDMQKIEDYLTEINIISKDIIENNKDIDRDEYIDRLEKLKNGIENSKTSFLVSKYKEYKIKSIDSLILGISKNEDKYLEKFNMYSKLSDEELEKLIDKKILEVTYLSASTYI